MRTFPLVTTLLITAAPAALSPAFAQSAPPTPAAEQSGLGEIIVTARRTAENLQRVPVATSVISSQALSSQRVTIARDLQFAAPSLVVNQDALSGSSAPVFELRGQQQTLGSDPTVVTYFGDVPVDTRVVAAGIYDLESVQVIRGPQGTLFGKNSTGGAVVLTPEHADVSGVNGNASIAVGNYDLRQATGAINVPLIKDVLGVRVSGQIVRQHGFVKNLSGPDGNDKHYETGRIAVRFTPTEQLKNDLLFNYFHGDQHENPSIVYDLGGFALFFPQALAGLARQKELGNRTIDESISPNQDKNRSWLISNTTSYDFGGVTLKNIIGYYKIHADNRFNETSFNFPLVDVEQNRRSHQFSEELQINGHALNNDLSWIVGGFYSNQRTTVLQSAIVFTTTPGNVTFAYDKFISKAIFAQATYDLEGLGLSGLKLTGGVRSTWDKRTGSQAVLVQSLGIPSLVGPIQLKTRRTSWTVGLDYQVTPNTLLYVASRHSYKAGGFNLTSIDTPLVFRTYQPETLTDIEIGAKTQFNAGPVPVRANLALYRGWYKDIHSYTVIRCFLQSGGSIVVNAADGSPKGLEFELQAKPTPRLQISGFYNRTLGKYGKFALPTPPPPCVFTSNVNDLSGQIFGNIYKNAGGLTIDYTIPLGGSGGELAFNGNMYTRSRKPGNDLKSLNSPVPGYTLFNARVDLNNFGGGPFSVGVFVRNITNKLYTLINAENLSTGGYNYHQYGDPRTYGVEARVKF
jgi:iron complex outermembrane receptor protein